MACLTKPAPATLVASASELVESAPPTKEPVSKPLDVYKPAEEPKIIPEKSPFIVTPKPLPHSPKISPSSIPNPSPSVTTTKQVEPGYSNYGSYLYSIPGYSAFQPINHQSIAQVNQPSVAQKELPSTSDFVSFPRIIRKDVTVDQPSDTNENHCKIPQKENQPPISSLSNSQTDFEEKITPEGKPAVSVSDVNKTETEQSKMSISSLAQSSNVTVTMPEHLPGKETKKKPTERFSLKTSIPISKIDMKCVNSHQDILQNNLNKRAHIPFNPAFHQKPDIGKQIEIKSNIILKSALKEPESNENSQTISTSNIPTTSSTICSVPSVGPVPTNSITTLINAAEAINNSENQFWKSDIISETDKEVKDSKATDSSATNFNLITRPIFNPINIEANHEAVSNKHIDATNVHLSEQKNQIVFIQNKTQSNPKMLVTIQQQNPQVLLQKSNCDPKNLLTPSRLSSQTKKYKEELMNESSTSKVVSLKRMHHENYDENDFENLITENQIYGNKIVVKEKSQDQHIKNKIKLNDKFNHPETKNVVLQPNILYLSNVQFPNLMMIKHPKVNLVSDSVKVTIQENRISNDAIPTSNTEHNAFVNTHSIASSKEIHIHKANNTGLQNVSSKTKSDIVLQTSTTKVIMSPQIVYQVPMIVDSDRKFNSQLVGRDYWAPNKKEDTKPSEQPKHSDKLFIACPYQIDPKMQPKIVITNIKTKIAKLDEVSSLDVYEKKKRMRRLKYLCKRETKDTLRGDSKKFQEKNESFKQIITADNMKAEIHKEFANNKQKIRDTSSDSDSEYAEDEINEYNAIINEYGCPDSNENAKIEFLSNLRLATHITRKDIELERQARIIKTDSVAAAYIAAGRLDRLPFNEFNTRPVDIKKKKANLTPIIELQEKENTVNFKKKKVFLSQLQLVQVSQQFKQEYETTWQEIVKEKNRRSGITDSDSTTENSKIKIPVTDLDTNCQLKLLTEIKKSVNDNNNLIKRKLDSMFDDGDLNEDSISKLAEKNFSELNRLSKMADRSVKLFSRKETKIRDLNPGFDSENIQKPPLIEQPFNNYPNINIPDISKIISLRSTTDPTIITTTQATSMDEPLNSAAGVKEMFYEKIIVDAGQDFSCQVEEVFPWPGVEEILKSYREYDIGRKRELAELQRRNTALRVESAHASRSAARHAEQARALLAERQALAREENAARLSLQRLWVAIDVIRSHRT